MMNGERSTMPSDAVGAIIKILEPLEETARRKILQAVQAYFQDTTPFLPPPPGGRQDNPPKDIRTLREEKQPKTAIEMAAVMAYYLKELAPVSKRKEVVTAQEVETYFNQAGFPLPKQHRMTLINARNAGYFESAGEGQFKLNAVGYNLVAYSLPKSGGSGKPKARSKRFHATQGKKTSRRPRAAQKRRRTKK